MQIKHYFPNIPLHVWARMTEAQKKEVLKKTPCRVEEQTPNFFVTLNHQEEMDYGVTAKLDQALSDS